MKILRSIGIIILLQVSFKCYSQSYLEFVENKGQWADNISYKGLLHSGAIALKPDGGYRMLQHNIDDLKALHDYYHPEKNAAAKISANNTSLGLHSHVYEVSFLNANPQPQVIAEKPQDTYNNYYIDNDPGHWASGCKIYQAITYKNIYPNIDVRYYTGNEKLKYDFIVHPGGNPDQIALVFDGTDDVKIKKGNLVITTSVAEEKELKPFTFQPSANGKKEISCRYKLTANILTFNVDEYDKTQSLVIDPTKIFATFTGSTADNWGFTATYDASGCFYAGGVVFGSGFPVSNGSSFQGGFNDNEEGNAHDIGIIKFNATGKQRIYATYIGGSQGNEQPHSMVVDNAGNLFISGRTNSPNYPITSPLFGLGGGRDIILTKLNASGNLAASIKIGGTGNDGMNIKPKYSNTPVKGTLSLNRNYGDDARSEVIVDDAGNVLLASCTQSTDFFVTPNAFQSANGGASTTLTRKQDAVFIEANNNLNTLLTSTYLGGDNDDAAFVLSINPVTKNIYIAGGTASINFPGDKTGVYQSVLQGGDCDGFVAMLNPTGTQLLKSSYFGTFGSENIYGIQFDSKGFPYIMGTTTGQWPVVAAPYNAPFAKQFIAKLQPDLSGFVYSTIFGTAPTPVPNISPTAFLVDRCENVYVSGWGGSINSDRGYVNAGTSGLPITANALQSQTDGSDVYFFVLERGAKSQLYGDFFGQNGGAGEHVDGGTSRFDREGIIYQSLCANCGGGAAFPVTPGAYSTVNGAANCNLAAVKIAFNLSGVGSGVRSSIKGVNGDTSGCVPLKIVFQDTLAQGSKYIWDFGDGSPMVTTTKPDTFHVYNNIGIYTVKLITVDSSSCNIVDSSFKKMRIRSDSASLKLAAKKVGSCFSNTYEFDNTGSAAPPTKPFQGNSFIINFGDGTAPQQMGYGTIQHSYANAGPYTIRMILVDTNYCNEPDTVSVSINIIANIKAQFDLPPTGCLKGNVSFINTSLGGTSLVWYFGDGDSSTAANPVYAYNSLGVFNVKLVIRDSFSCNKIDSVIHPFTIAKSATALFSYNPVPPKVNTAVNFFNQSVGAITYLWTFGDGDSLRTNSISIPVSHIFQANDTFNTCLVAYNQFGCTDTFCKPIIARVNPLYDVPNAIAPNGINNKIFVRGFGIQRIAWNIYNRWGILMFSTNDIKEGWDGKFKGEVQPQDVYHYTLLVEFYDGKKENKTGDITLLR